MRLNQQQSEAVRIVDRPLLVLAGAGSGKTRVITEKIKYLIEQHRYAPKSIYAVTFTNKAANEMRERLMGTLGKERAKAVRVRTFHTLGLSILKRHGHFLGLRSGFSIYDQNDSAHLLALIAPELDSNELALLQDRIGSWKNDRLLPEGLRGRAKDDQEALAIEYYAEYQKHLLAYNAVDFDDLVLKTLLLLERESHVLAYWQDQVRYLLVDEYQDTNVSQYHLVRVLMGDRPHFTVVGDDDQSIYAWRGARPENLNDLAKDFPNLELIKLEQNYRSTGHILKAANRLIAVNPHLYDKSLWSTLGEGDPIEIHDFSGDDEEAEFIADHIAHQQLVYKRRLDSFAILYRGNHQSRRFEMALQRRRIPVNIVGGTSFFQQEEVNILLHYLKLIANPEDDAALLRVINIPSREIGAASLLKLTEFAKVHELTLFETLAHPQLHSFIGRNIAHRCLRFHQIILEAQALLDDVEALFHQLIESINYSQYLQEISSSPQAFERRMKSVEQLSRWFIDQPRNLREILSHLTLISILESSDGEKEQDAVTLMTLHSAKGLEFPTVFLVGAEEDIIPHRNSIDEGESGIQEERRLFYVGITRAQKQLFITYCRQRRRYGEWESRARSRFIDELPEENILRRGESAPSKEELQQVRSDTFAALTAMLEGNS